MFVVNILDETQEHLSVWFSAPSEDKFEDVDFRSGVPVLRNALATIECRLKHVYNGGDHSIFVGQVENINARNGDSLIYFQGEYKGAKE